jgi:spermidine synthase
MATFPVLALLFYDLIVFVGAISSARKSQLGKETAFPLVLFFISGMPALIYQIVWQRALFAIYGVNAESVAVIVSAFMLGLGIGSLAGGWLSGRYPRQAVMMFGVAELGIAVFGLFSLHIFHWISAFTAGTGLPRTILFSFLLLTIPTVLMGASLPMLVEHLVRFSCGVGRSVATLYFVNTFGSAVACYLCAIFLLRVGGQSGSIFFAAILNVLVALAAFYLVRDKREPLATDLTASWGAAPNIEAVLPLSIAIGIAGISGFLALGYEMAWFRLFVLASSDRAPAFALLLSTYLAGVAAGSFIAGKLTEGRHPKEVLRIIGLLMLIAGAASALLPPLVAYLRLKNLPFLLSAAPLFVAAALLGAVMPLSCKIAVNADLRAGARVSLIYGANILGSTLGSFIIGFILFNHFGLRQVSIQLATLAVISGTFAYFFGCQNSLKPKAWALATICISVATVPVASQMYSQIFERLIFGSNAGTVTPLADIVENRNGVVVVTKQGAVFGGGVYDGYFNVDPLADKNLIVRAFALGSFKSEPRNVLEIGLSSGSWAQVLVSHPDVQSLEIVEINSAYLQLIAQYPMVSSVLHNPKISIYVDDGRRWLLAHPERRYDTIVANTSFYWRDHSSNLLSVDFLEIIRQHLNPGGVFYYNTTGSDDVLATGLHVFPYGLRVLNFLAVSDSPIHIDRTRWMQILKEYRVDGKLVFNPKNPKSAETLQRYKKLVDSINQPQNAEGIENLASFRSRLGKRLIITDDNMGWEWRESPD